MSILPSIHPTTATCPSPLSLARTLGSSPRSRSPRPCRSPRSRSLPSPSPQAPPVAIPNPDPSPPPTPPITTRSLPSPSPQGPGRRRGGAPATAPTFSDARLLRAFPGVSTAAARPPADLRVGGALAGAPSRRAPGLPSPACRAAAAGSLARPSRSTRTRTAARGFGYAGRGDVFPIYIGDDRTDEDAFKVLRNMGQGIGILLTKFPKETSASYSLREPAEVGLSQVPWSPPSPRQARRQERGAALRLASPRKSDIVRLQANIPVCSFTSVNPCFRC